MTTLSLHLRDEAIQLFNAGLAAADPSNGIKQFLTYQSQQLQIKTLYNDTIQQRSEDWSKVHLIALGKAACKMAISSHNIIPPHLLSTDNVVITNYENVQTVS